MNSGLTISLATFLPTAPRTLKTQERFQTGTSTSYFGIPATLQGLSIEVSYPGSTDLRKVSTGLGEAKDSVYTSTVASLTYSVTKDKVMPTMDFANEILESVSSATSFEVLREDGAIDDKKNHFQRPTSQSKKNIPDKLNNPTYQKILPPTSREEPTMAYMSPVSSEQKLVSVKASNALSPAKELVRQGTVAVSTLPRVDVTPTVNHEYLQDISPTWVVSGIWRIPKTPGTPLSHTNTIIPGSIHRNQQGTTSDFRWRSVSIKSMEQEIKSTPILRSPSSLLATDTSASMYYEESPGLGDTQTSPTNILPTSSTPDSKPSNGDDLIVSGNKGPHYSRTQSLGIILGSVSGASIIIFCGIILLHRPCYRRFRESRKTTIWIAHVSQNRDDGNISFARHSEHREISRFSVDS